MLCWVRRAKGLVLVHSRANHDDTVDICRHHRWRRRHLGELGARLFALTIGDGGGEIDASSSFKSLNPIAKKERKKTRKRKRKKKKGKEGEESGEEEEEVNKLPLLISSLEKESLQVKDSIILAMSSVLEGGRSPSGDALRSYASRVGVNPKDGPSGPSGKVGDVGAEPTGNFVVVLTPLFHRAGTERAGERPR
uniref:Uncharacterized protein n=1 Tax=Ananas comosus var. bracteatus TaxID=296719 RepID=A0A6V7QLI3_ANACO|nr:unnamed protein product [Ananas comosus var. bracteatus]